jgi:hypothetical protein
VIDYQTSPSCASYVSIKVLAVVESISEHLNLDDSGHDEAGQLLEERRVRIVHWTLLVVVRCGPAQNFGCSACLQSLSSPKKTGLLLLNMRGNQDFCPKPSLGQLQPDSSLDC